MTRASIPLLMVLAAAALLCPIPGSGQSRWEAIAGGPVLTPGSSAWDVLAVGQPSCFVDEGVFRVFYAGAGADARGRIVTAISDDGLEWTDAGELVLDIGEPGGWDRYAVDTPEAVRVGGVYHLYYYGAGRAASEGASLGLAISVDGQVWRRIGEGPVLYPGLPGAWDWRWIESPAVVYDEVTGIWSMYYTGLDPGWQARIGLATSTDGVQWTKHPDNPVLDVGDEGSWQDAWVAVPTVVNEGGRLRMWYCGVSRDDIIDGRVDHPAVGEAVSLDGVQWHRASPDPVFPVRAEDQELAPWAPCVVRDEARRRYLMLFETAEGIHAATTDFVRRPRRPAGRARAR